MKKNYENGGYGSGHGKKDLLKLILNNYSEERQKYNHYISNPSEVNEILIHGATKAKLTADEVLTRVRKKLGYWNEYFLKFYILVSYSRHHEN